MKYRFPWMISAAAFLGAACSPDLPTDAELIATFEDNRVAFEEVRQIVLETPGIERIEEGGAELLPLPSAKRAAIARFMDEADVPLIRVWKTPGGKQYVDFTFHGSGLAVGGAMKGIVWSNTRPAPPLLDSLDDPSDSRGFVTPTWFKANRPLKDGWYLYLSKD